MAEIKLNTQRLRNTLYDDEALPMQAKPEGRFSNWKKYIPDTRFFIIIILLLQCVQIYFFFNPLNLLQQLQVVDVINDVSKKVSIPPTEIPVVGVIGDNKVLPDIETLKKENDANAQVYKDAKNGDYVLGYSSKMVIYRKEEQRVIYEGLSPVSLVTNTQNSLVTALTNKTKEAGLIASDSNQVPSVSVVTDVASVKVQDQKFYADLQKDDLIGVFAQSNLIVIYRPSSQRIINSGKVNTTITK